MKIEFIDPVQKEIAEFLVANSKLRALFLDPACEYTCREILRDLLMLIPYKQRELTLQVFESLASVGDLPYIPCGKNTDGEQLYKIRQELVEEMSDYFPPQGEVS